MHSGRSLHQNREYLLTLSPTNRSTTTVIQESLFSLSLDAHTLAPRDQPSSAPTSSTTKLTRPDVDAQVYNTAFGGPSGLNRWFDKALSVMVESNGRAGMMGEHSPCDALIPSIIVDYAIAEHMDKAQFGEHNNLEVGSTKAWDKLEWVVDEKLEGEIERAKKDAKKLIADSEPSQLWFGEYGAEWMKAVGKSAHVRLPLCARFTTENTFLILALQCFSEMLSRRLHPDGAPIGMVQGPRVYDRDVRNGFYTPFRAWPNRSHPNIKR